MSLLQNSLLKCYLRIAAIILIYWTISIAMVFLNKILLSARRDFGSPLFIAWFQCCIAILCCYSGYLLSLISPKYMMKFPKPEVDFKKCLKILPLSTAFVAMIVFNNLSLKHLNVSFYYVGRSLSTVFNVILTYMVLGQKTSVKAIICCGAIMFGFFLGVDQEKAAGSLSDPGLIYGLLSSFFVSLNAICTKTALSHLKGDLWLLAFYNNLVASALFIPLMMISDEEVILPSMEALTDLKFWSEMTLAGVFGFAIGCATGLQIRETSPLTHNISGTAKAAAQTVIAVYSNGENKATLWWASNGVVLIGSMLYAQVRALEMSKN